MDFSKKIRLWYQKNKRDLPWRKNKNPYKIWLSEIILQQTRVDQGLSYYHKFLLHYPDIEALAKASEQDVLNDWQGLGYYSRARNLHFTAKFIVEDYNGIFPKTYSEILKLKGVGNYTAAAIASFAYDLPHAVVDGNVFRVLSRIFGLHEAIDTPKGKKYFEALAQELLSKKHASEHNQAIMEFGALHCLPKKPKCEICVFQADCWAFQNQAVDQLPIKIKKIKKRTRFFNYLVFKNEEAIYFQKRENKDIWQNLYDFPLIEAEALLEIFDEKKIKEFLETNFGLLEADFALFQRSENHQHILTHQKIFACFWEINIFGVLKNQNKLKLVEISKINTLPIPKLIQNYLNNTNFLKTKNL